MSKVKSVLALSLSVSLLAACASTVPMNNISQEVVSLEKPKVSLEADSNTAVLTIVRDDTFVRDRSARLFVDGNEVGRIEYGQVLRVPVTPGSHKLKMKFESGSVVHTNSVTLKAEAGQKYFYKMKRGSQGGIGGYYGGLVTTSFRLLPTTATYVNNCCDLTVTS
jgi:hypothetical protein